MIPLLSRTGSVFIEGDTTGAFAPVEFTVRNLFQILNIDNNSLVVDKNSVRFTISENKKLDKINMDNIVHKKDFDLQL